jgi:hypothetical protein
MLLLTLGAHAANAGSDPLPGEAIAPPPNTNIVMFYNVFSDAGSYAGVNGDTYDQHTHISTNSIALRYIHTFNTGGLLTGVQMVVPYVSFIGGQETGISDIPAPAGVPSSVPSYGPGRANLSHNSGFGEPMLGAFVFPYNNPATGTYLVVGPWIDIPIGSYEKTEDLNATSNLWTYEIEAGFRTVLLGTPEKRNLAVEAWGEGYLYGSNGDSALTSPEVYADNIPSAYQTLNAMTHGAVPDANPLSQGSSTPARLSEQPSAELRVYLPYQFYPRTLAMVAPGIFQSFGGKQYYTLENGTKEDAGTRTQETQLRLIVSSFVSPHWQLMLTGNYDLIAHGAPLNREVELRLSTFF